MIDCTDHTVLTLPGYLNSGPGHWQTRWEALHGRHGPARGAVSGASSGHFAFTRVQMADWDHPAREAWCRTLDEAIAAAEGPVLLAAHSMGCLTVAFWATQYATPERAAKVAGALLVAVPDPAGAVFPATRRASRPCRSNRCRFPPPSWRAATTRTAALRFPPRARRRGAAAGSTSAHAGTSMPTAVLATGNRDSRGSRNWRASHAWRRGAEGAPNGPGRAAFRRLTSPATPQWRLRYSPIRRAAPRPCARRAWADGSPPAAVSSSS